MKKYIIGIVLTLLISLGGVFNSDTKALDNDYKNNLLKVDVNRVSGDTYTIDLFTQKPYNEPIRVRKKSDTSYYVLLPETYHSITSVGGAGDVSKVDVKLYPYAGQDLNNGYTKINIQTTKPVNFSTNVRTATKQVPSIDAKKLAQLDNAFENKPSYAQQTEVVQKPVVKQVLKPSVPVTVKEPVKTVAEQPVKVAQSAPVTVAVQPQRAPHATNSEIEIVTKPIKQKEVVKEEPTKVAESAPANLEEVVDPDVTKEDKTIEEDAREQGLTELAEGEDTEAIPALTKKQQMVQNLKNIKAYVLENFLLLLAIVLLIIALYLLVSPKRAAKPVARKEENAPADEVQAEPVAQDYANIPPYTEGAVLPEQKDYEVYEAHIEPAPEGTPVYVAPAEPVDEGDEEAEVLSTESFGEGRGLCLVNFNGEIALVGFIEDEIFVIQNFGKITLINPAIQVRVAEQNDDSTVYIVKAANSKLMVKETKTFIGLEMVM